MIKMYFLTAFRSLLRNKSYSILNISGLALGITCSILLFLVIKFELSYDSFHQDKDKIYRVNTLSKFPDGDDLITGSHYPLPALLRQNLPASTEAITQVFGEEGGQINISTGTNATPKRFVEESTIGFVEPEFFSFFNFDTGGKDLSRILAEPNQVVLTQSTAEKYFPDEDAVGKVFKFNNKLNLQVGAVIPDLPMNTDFPFSMFISYVSFKNYSPFADTETWNSLSSPQQLFVKISENTTPEQAIAEINALADRHMPKQETSITTSYKLQPLTDLHFNPDLSNYSNRTVPKETIWAMGVIGLFLVLVACINFINLATAKALKRAKEVGVRKVMGSSKQQLMLQFMGETFLITSFATFLSVILVELTLPHLNNLLEFNITFSLIQDPVLLLFLLAELLLVTFFAGIYPALVMTKFQPIEALKSKISTQKVAGLSLRRSLVVLQFTICQVLIICTVLVNEQMDYFRNKELGFDKDAVVTVQLPTGAGQKILPLRQEMKTNPAVKNVSASLSPPSALMTWSSNFYFDNSSKEAPFNANMKMADENYLDLYNIKLVAGRKYADSDTLAFIINETMRKRLNISSAEEAIGKSLAIQGGRVKGRIVGVVEDFHHDSLHEPVAPIIIKTDPGAYWFLSAKIDLAHKQEALAHLENVWNKAYPDDAFNYKFLDETIADFYEEEARQSTLFKVFSLIAILIGCIGLYGLVAFMAAQRTKEVGIRKVMGASVFNIVLLFSKEFIKLVLIAFIIAVPIAYYLMNLWLQDFSYRITLHIWPFVLAGAATLVIAIITMSAQAVKAALANPAIALKSE